MEQQEAQVKPLPRDENGEIARRFTANGREYIIRTAEEGTTIERYSAMQKMSAVLGLSATFENLIGHFDELTDCANSLVTKEPRLNELFIRINNLKRGVLETSQTRYDMGLYYCTLFIVQEDEDMTTWVKAEQEEKIKDWNEEGYDVHDFLALALGSIEGFFAVYKDFNQRVARGELEIEPTSGSTESTTKEE